MPEEHRNQKIPIIHATLLGILNLLIVVLLFVAQEVWQIVQRMEANMYAQATSIALVLGLLRRKQLKRDRHKFRRPYFCIAERHS